MIRITLTTKDNPQPVPVYENIKSMGGAKMALESIREAWALDGHPIRYDGRSLFVGDVATYTIEGVA